MTYQKRALKAQCVHPLKSPGTNKRIQKANKSLRVCDAKVGINEKLRKDQNSRRRSKTSDVVDQLFEDGTRSFLGCGISNNETKVECRR